MKKNIVLFDMDGTLTPARQKISHEMILRLRELSKISEIGIVTGSGLGYLLEQCSEMWSRFDGCDPNMITLLPCNGTKMLKWKSGDFQVKSNVSMKEEIGHVMYTRLIECLLSAQRYFIRYTKPVCSMSGTFISYRGSLLNYCPIGRDSLQGEREKFVD